VIRVRVVLDHWTVQGHYYIISMIPHDSKLVSVYYNNIMSTGLRSIRFFYCAFHIADLYRKQVY
jgi:hypothetical protein